jgi:phosphatidylinositol glycan class B
MLKTLTINAKQNINLFSQDISISWFFVILILHLGLAYFYQDYFHPDEHYQILEFADYKFYHYTFQYPWELYEKIRPTIQIWGVIGLKYLLPNTSPFVIAFITRAFAGTLSAYACYLFIHIFQKELKSTLHQSWFLLLSIFSYFILYQSVRYSSENISGQLFLIGFCFIYRQSKHVFLIGSILGLAFITRYQTGFLIFGLVSWLFFIKKTSDLTLLTLCAGILASILIGFLLDSLFYGSWALTSWNYFYQNIYLHKANNFGISHWTYLSLASYLPWGPFYLIGTIYFLATNRKSAITWTIFPFIFIHQMIPHKELRFLWPVLSFMPFVSIYSLQELEKKINLNLSKNQMVLFINKANWYINNFIVLALALIFWNFMQNYQFLWNHFNTKPYTLYLWTTSETLQAKNSVSYGMPYRFYLNQNTIIQQYNNTHSYKCNLSYPCILWQPCFTPILPNHLIFDSCPSPKIYQFGNINNWKERSAFFKNKGRLYQIFPNIV